VNIFIDKGRWYEGKSEAEASRRGNHRGLTKCL